MVKGFINFNINLIELGEVMKYVVLIVEVVGVSIEDIIVLFGVLVDNGIKGSMVGIGISVVFS